MSPFTRDRLYTLSYGVHIVTEKVEIILWPTSVYYASIVDVSEVSPSRDGLLLSVRHDDGRRLFKSGHLEHLDILVVYSYRMYF